MGLSLVLHDLTGYRVAAPAPEQRRGLTVAQAQEVTLGRDPVLKLDLELVPTEYRARPVVDSLEPEGELDRSHAR
jgi:hypothetical protein